MLENIILHRASTPAEDLFSTPQPGTELTGKQIEITLKVPINIETEFQKYTHQGHTKQIPLNIDNFSVINIRKNMAVKMDQKAAFHHYSITLPASLGIAKEIV